MPWIIWNSAHISSSKGRYAHIHGFSHYCGTREHKGNNLWSCTAIKITSDFYKAKLAIYYSRKEEMKFSVSLIQGTEKNASHKNKFIFEQV